MVSLVDFNGEAVKNLAYWEVRREGGGREGEEGGREDDVKVGGHTL